MDRLRDRNVLLCVGGGIAAYKAPEVVRRLQECGARVQVAMTEAARSFITPLTLQAVSRNPVATDLLSPTEDATIGHIRIAETADVILVAPATADLIARMAAGSADDIVTASILAATVPVVVAPSMNTHMLSHPAVVANIERLRSWMYRIVAPDSGELACGYEGAGRLPDADVLIDEITAALSNQDLAGRSVLVSAGPTREPIDPVRFISNRSSGRMGYAIAAAARRRGARVTLVSGPTSLACPRGCQIVRVETAAEMNDAMRARVTEADAVVMVAAVADYRPETVAERKIKKRTGTLDLRLTKTEDILAGLGRSRGQRLLVGFAAETDDLRVNARAKLAAKGLDLIVANDVGQSGQGFDTATNRAILIDRFGEETDTGLLSKAELAERILDRMAGLLARSDLRSGGRVEKLG
jgi:phosphopantothenoylcysteine decarboxylase/phosphopantothenate--cysteine ligase